MCNFGHFLQGEESIYEEPSAFQCLKCAEGCEDCEDASPCIVTLNWVLRTILLILQCVIIGCLPVVVLFTYKYKDIKVNWFVVVSYVVTDKNKLTKRDVDNDIPH